MNFEIIYFPFPAPLRPAQHQHGFEGPALSGSAGRPAGEGPAVLGLRHHQAGDCARLLVHAPPLLEVRGPRLGLPGAPPPMGIRGIGGRLGEVGSKEESTGEGKTKDNEGGGGIDIFDCNAFYDVSLYGFNSFSLFQIT